MVNRKSLALIISMLLACPAISAYATTAAAVQLESNGDKTITLKKRAKKATQYKFNKEGLLVHKKRRSGLGITYVYNANKVLAYASTDRGAIYSVARDLKGRVKLISGIGLTKLEVTYNSDSTAPSQVTITKQDGTLLKPRFVIGAAQNAAGINTLAHTTDQKLAAMYEFSALSDPCELDPESGDEGCAGGGGDGGGGDGGGGDGGDGGGGGGDPTDPNDPPPDEGCNTGSAKAPVTARSARAFSVTRAPVRAAGGPGYCPAPPPVNDPASTCNRQMDQWVEMCNRIYPGADNGTGDLDGRRLCYAQGNEEYAKCLAQINR
ncbi:hypothetical protein [Undibacterium sp.]|uniref:hypothetical protein n=1 Tax=Undibacterium sp. TaxID=1914977 RepID=UPI002B675D92|nr:hypothetical protein [Undibacterium sp.]HTD05869.1 hypothetical protein [Undibacterium sp.]